jgi:hypothetical protein
MAVSRNISGAARTRTHRPQCFLHGGEDRRVLAHAEIVVRTPHGDLGPDAMVKGARKLPAAPIEIGKDAVATFGAQRIEALSEEAFVVH